MMKRAKRVNHGQSHRRTYWSWQAMKSRCYDPNHKHYARYGGRGIQVCDRWQLSFLDFLADMGECPPKHGIDRIDNNGNYEPSNCRWASNTQQSRNRSSNHRITINGVTKCLTDWSEEYGIVSAKVASDRINYLGWEPLAAFTKPARALRRST
jgi:hypothetical protein